jgi:hypothetical protein
MILDLQTHSDASEDSRAPVARQLRLLRHLSRRRTPRQRDGASEPHACIDPVAPPAQIVTNLQTMAWLVCLLGLTANDKYVDPALRLL